jgi:type I restriction enzyme, S subunit
METMMKRKEAVGSWPTVQLGQVARAVSGIGFPKDLQGRSEGVYPVFKVGDISAAWLRGDKQLDESEHNLTEDLVKRLRGTPLPAGTTVFAKIGEGLKLNRRMLLARPALVDNNVMGLIPSDEVHPEYLYLFMTTVDLGELSQATTVPSVRKSDIDGIEIPLPSLPEQRRIVSAIETQLGRLDAAVARLHAAKAKLKRYKQAVLKAAYTGQLFAEEADMSDDAPLPDGWRWGTLGDFVKIRNGFAFKSTDYRDEGALLIRQSNLGGSKVTTEGARYLPEHYLDEHPGFQVVKGDILIGMSGSIGKLCTYDLDYPALQNQRTGLLQFKDEKQKPWVWSYLPLLEQSLLQQGKGVAVLNVSAKQVESSPVPVAPIEVQQRIIDEVEQRMRTIDETEATLDAQLLQSTRLRQAVLKRAFEGRLV